MLNRLRKEIDEIDKQLLALFEQRMDVAAQVGAYKKAHNLPVLVPEREQAVLENRIAAVKNPAYAKLAADFFKDVMALSRRLQQSNMPVVPKTAPKTAAPRAAYLGRPGSYSEEALYRLYPQAAAAVPADTFAGVFEQLAEGRADVAILPVENTSTGAIADVLDLLYTHNLYINSETTLRIQHVLAAPAGAPLAGIRRVYSHPQGFLQCADFLKTLHNAEQIPLASTADSALFVAQSQDPTQAAIVSRRAAALYGLEILQEDIQSADTNTTRFIAVSAAMEDNPGADTVSLAFTLRHESGSLYSVLSVFARYGLNLLYLQSRPLPGRNFEYLFFADFSGHLSGEAENKVLEEIRTLSTDLRVLGNYTSARELLS